MPRKLRLEKAVLVRMPEALHADISDEAQRREISINAEILRRLMLRRWQNQKDIELGYHKQRAQEHFLARQRLIEELPGSRPF